MKQRNTFGMALLAALAFALPLNAQNHNWCGVSTQSGAQIKAQLHENRHEMADYVSDRTVTTYVPVRFFLVAKTDGTGRASEKLALAALCKLNENYADQDIQFYIKELKYLNNTTIFSNPTSFGGSNAIANQMIYNALNIFIVNEMSEEGVLAYYQPDAGPNGNDWIVALQSYVDEDLVLTHEVGHFFSLNHTFYGWESTGGWDPILYGNPVGTTSPDGITNEMVNGSNCNNAGDDICDTPADYMFPNNSCDYTQNAKDPNGQLLNPDIYNFMNYVYNCGNYHFSDGQKTAIHNSLFSNNRNYVRPNYTPNLDEVTGAPTIVSPASGSTVDTYNNVQLEWSALAGADHYFLEVTKSGTPAQRYISTTNSIVLTNLDPSTTYLWKVMGYNEYSTCGSFSSQKIFKTGNLINDTSDSKVSESWNVSPNPVKIGQPINLNMESAEGLEAEVTIFGATGQVAVGPVKYKFAGGLTALEIETDGLAPGFYLVSLQTANSLQTERVAVVR